MEISQDISGIINELGNLESEIKSNIEQRRNNSSARPLNDNVYGISGESYSNPPPRDNFSDSPNISNVWYDENAEQFESRKNESSLRTGNERKKQKKNTKADKNRESLPRETASPESVQSPTQATDSVSCSLPLPGTILLDDFKRGFIMSELLGPPLSRRNI